MTAASSPPTTSGPAVARLFHRLLALIFLIAWLSLGSQILLLIGSRGLLPVAPFVHAVKSYGLGFQRLPTLFLYDARNAALRAGIWIGIALALLAFIGVRPRLCFLLSTVLYLSYAVACRDFLGFQWDNLLIECGALAVFLPRDRRSPWIHFLFRVLVLKLYFESGFSKLESPIHDWLNGSAMTFYYETAPLPTWLAWYAHHLPAWWHHFESRATLGFELGVSLCVFGPRPLRYAAAFVFTAFQLADIATANYGFFCFLSLALNVFLFTDHEVERAAELGRALLRRARARLGSYIVRHVWARVRLARKVYGRWAAETHFLPRLGTRWVTLGRTGVAAVVTSVYLLVSLNNGIQTFDPNHPKLGALTDLSETLAPFRLINSYHLFATVTRQRVEPEFETSNGTRWVEHELKYKPGNVDRAPPFVAPHQPRVDFLLWFYGLNFHHMPRYVSSLLGKMCNDPEAVDSLFAKPLPPEPRAVRIVFFIYRFSTPREKRETGAWWQRARFASTHDIPCERFQLSSLRSFRSALASRRISRWSSSALRPR